MEDQDGRTVLTFEGDETRGGSTGRLHRALVKFDNRGVSTSFSSLIHPCTLSEINCLSLGRDEMLMESCSHLFACITNW